jgi:WhiB family redox-sensing transcriptional regulator
MWVDDWASQAACRESQPDQLFVRGAEQHRAKQVCNDCPVRAECLAEALDNQIEWGVWGGMTERERRALLRRSPSTTWRAVLEAARVDDAAPDAAPAPSAVTAGRRDADG